jgi:hypothetical protein
MHPAVVSVVLGAVKPAEIEANVADTEHAVPPVSRSNGSSWSRPGIRTAG